MPAGHRPTRRCNIIGNRSGIVLDDDGQYVFTIRDNDTLDTCYSYAKFRGTHANGIDWPVPLGERKKLCRRTF
jgi:hypothetical protein